MKIKTIQSFIESKQDPEILFWIGCAGSYDERYKKVTKAFIKILNKLSVDSYTKVSSTMTVSGATGGHDGPF